MTKSQELRFINLADDITFIICAILCMILMMPLYNLGIGGFIIGICFYIITAIYHQIAFSKIRNQVEKDEK